MGLVLILTVLGTASSALAQKRVALVIGNGTYTKVARLNNPKNDAAAMEAMFNAAGFSSVVRLNDLGGDGHEARRAGFFRHGPGC